jgi:hypothetical protein
VSLMTRTQARDKAAAAAAAARQGTYSARVWAAPRLERTGQALEQRVAPTMAAMLSSAARRIDPAPAKRRRWPFVAAGLMLAAGLCGTAAYLVNRRAARQWGQTPEPTRAPEAPDTAEEPTGSHVNGRVHTR